MPRRGQLNILCVDVNDILHTSERLKVERFNNVVKYKNSYLISQSIPLPPSPRNPLSPLRSPHRSRERSLSKNSPLRSARAHSSSSRRRTSHSSTQHPFGPLSPLRAESFKDSVRRSSRRASTHQEAKGKIDEHSCSGSSRKEKDKEKKKDKDKEKKKDKEWEPAPESITAWQNSRPLSTLGERELSFEMKRQGQDGCSYVCVPPSGPAPSAFSMDSYVLSENATRVVDSVMSSLRERVAASSFHALQRPKTPDALLALPWSKSPERPGSPIEFMIGPRGQTVPVAAPAEWGVPGPPPELTLARQRRNMTRAVARPYDDRAEAKVFLLSTVSTIPSRAGKKSVRAAMERAEMKSLPPVCRRAAQAQPTNRPKRF